MTDTGELGEETVKYKTAYAYTQREKEKNRFLFNPVERWTKRKGGETTAKI